jgi:hypothetical protein
VLGEKRRRWIGLVLSILAPASQVGWGFERATEGAVCGRKRTKGQRSGWWKEDPLMEEIAWQGGECGRVVARNGGDESKHFDNRSGERETIWRVEISGR